MSKFNVKDKEQKQEWVELDNKFVVEHETEKGILIKNTDNDYADWFPKAYVDVSGKKIKVADWLHSKSDLFDDDNDGY